jgi:hypothetical protein
MTLDQEEATMEASPDSERTREALARISAALRGLRYGTVTAVVQDGVIVQVERTEKIRLERRDAKAAS